jgi:hypothetical protein
VRTQARHDERRIALLALPARHPLRQPGLIHATAAELPYVPLTDALSILLVLDARHEERFEPAAVRWAGRLATEAPGLGLAELAGALESLVALPDQHAQASLVALAGRARRPVGAPALRTSRRRSQQPGPRWWA